MKIIDLKIENDIIEVNYRVVDDMIIDDLCRNSPSFVEEIRSKDLNEFGELVEFLNAVETEV